jgi:hypothetical protein
MSRYPYSKWGMTPVNVILMETEGPGFDSQERH